VIHLKSILSKKKIGAGSAGEVVFGETAQGQKVAIKKLQLIRKGKSRLEFILREIEIIATSQHSNIVQYIESFHMGEELWVVMEFMSGGSLYDLLKLFPSGFRFSESETSYVIRDTLEAISYLHSMKRIHRDIKVDNILFSKDGTIKLADFGTAVQLTISHLKRTTLAGTPYYMAPELIQRLPYSEKVDIWSIGITVVEMVDGEPPYYEMDPHDALAAILQSEGSPNVGVRGQSPHMMDFVNKRCLNYDPLARSSAQQLLSHPFLSLACTKQEFSKKVCSVGGETPSSDGCTIL
jgi:serine/threonine protein kinase